MKTTVVRDQHCVSSALSNLWCQLLSRHAIKDDDHFFEIGGDSMLAIKMLVDTSKQFNVDLDLDAFFTSPTLHALCAQIMQNKTD